MSGLSAPVRWSVPVAVAAVCLALASPAAWAAADNEARAVIKAVDRVLLSSELAARVTSLPRRAGDAFRKGDLLVALDCDLHKAQSSKVAAELEGARLKLENARQLQELRSIGALEVSVAESDYTQTQAALRIAQLNAGRCGIRAPWSGRVVAVHVKPYENVRQQQELIEIINDGRFEAEVIVPAKWMRWLKPGTPLTLQVDETGSSAQAKVAAITPAIDAVSQTVVLRAAIADGSRLIPGMSATAVFNVPSTK